VAFGPQPETPDRQVVDFALHPSGEIGIPPALRPNRPARQEPVMYRALLTFVAVSAVFASPALAQIHPQEAVQPRDQQERGTAPTFDFDWVLEASAVSSGEATGGEFGGGVRLEAERLYGLAGIGVFIYPEEDTPYEIELERDGLITYEYCVDQRNGRLVDSELCQPETEAFGRLEGGVLFTPNFNAGIGARIGENETQAYATAAYRFAGGAELRLSGGQDLISLGGRFGF
jgi:hypothetical protein